MRFALVALLLTAGCADLLALDDYRILPAATPASGVGGALGTGGAAAGGAGGGGGEPARVLWARSYGSPGNDEVRRFAALADDRVLATGWAEQESFELCPMGGKLFVSMLGDGGTVLETMCASTPAGREARPNSIAWSNGLAVVAGWFDGALAHPAGAVLSSATDDQDGFVMALDENLDLVGAPLHLRGDGDLVMAKALPLGGDRVLVSGHFTGSLALAPMTTLTATDSASDGFLAEYNQTGLVWSQRISGADREQVFSASVYGDALALGGSFKMSIDGCSGTMNAQAADDGFVMWLELSTKACLQQLRIAGTNIQHVRRVAPRSDGSWIVAGVFDGEVRIGGTLYRIGGGVDIFVVVMNPDGQVLAGPAFSNAVGLEELAGLAVLPDDGVILTGAFTQDLGFESDVVSDGGSQDGFVLRLSANLELQWVETLRSSGADLLEAVAVSPSGHTVFVGGSFGSSPATLGSQEVTPHIALSDAVVAALRP